MKQHSTSQRNYAIDTLKFFCALLVIFIHTGDPLSIDIFTRIAVPCFFIISGYFIYNSDVALMQEKLRSTLKSVCIITAWGTLLYAFTGSITLSSVIKLLLFNESIWGFHLWYLWAYIYTLAVTSCLYKFNIAKIALYAIPILLSISVLFGLYTFLIFDDVEIPTRVTRNFLFCGTPYFLIGILIRRFSREIFNYKNIIYISTIVISLLTLVEHSMNIRSLGFGPGDFFATTAPLSVAIFLLALSIKQPKDNILSKIGREDSLYIYIFHPFVMMILDKLGIMFSVKDSWCYKGLAYSLLVFSLTIVISIVFRTTILPRYNKATTKLRV